MNKHITLIFDLDETVILSSQHGNSNNPDGTLNLEMYRRLHTAENVANDTLLPLARTMRNAIAQGYNVVILTARFMYNFDYAFLEHHGLKTVRVYSRDSTRCTVKHAAMPDGEYKARWFKLMPKKVRSTHCIMFDDSKPVKSAMRKLGLTVLCAHKVNKKLLRLSK